MVYSLEGLTDWLQEKLFAEKRVAGVELALLPSGGLLIQLLVLERLNGKIRIVKKCSDLPDLHSLVNELPAGIPCAVSITGKGVIQKAVVNIGAYAGNKVVNAVLQTADPADFFYEQGLVGVGLEVAILRRDTGIALLQRLQELQVTVVAVNLGFFALPAIAPLLARSLQLKTSTQCLDLNNGLVASYMTLPSGIPAGAALAIGENLLETPLVIAYASAARLLLFGPEEAPGLDLASLQTAIIAYRYKQRFRLATGAVLGAAFLLALVNYMVFSHYYASLNAYQSVQTESGAGYLAYSNLKQTLNKREHFFNSEGWLRSQKLSILADRVAATLPDSLQLTELTLVPAIALQSGSSATVHFAADTVLLSGKCRYPRSLTVWMDRLKALQQFKKVRLDRYVYDPKAGMASFSLEATL